MKQAVLVETWSVLLWCNCFLGPVRESVRPVGHVVVGTRSVAQEEKLSNCMAVMKTTRSILVGT